MFTHLHTPNTKLKLFTHYSIPVSVSKSKILTKQLKQTFDLSSHFSTYFQTCTVVSKFIIPNSVVLEQIRSPVQTDRQK